MNKSRAIKNKKCSHKVTKSQSVFLLCVPVSPCEDNKTNFPVR